MARYTFLPTAGEFYTANDEIRFRLRQKIDTTSDYTHNPIPSYIAASSYLLNAVPTQISATYWRFNLRHELPQILPFTDQNVDEYFDLPLIYDKGGIVIDKSALYTPQTITVPIATSPDDFTIQYPTNSTDPPIITAINYSDSFDYTVGYYPGGGASSYDNIGTFNLYSGTTAFHALTFADLRVTFPNIPDSGNTKFFNQLNITKSGDTWTASFARTLRQFNHNARAYTY